MKLIIETDLGHDPDDFFAISYLIAAGVEIQAIVISPGDPDQIAIAKLLCQEVGLDIPVCASKLDRQNLSSGSIHHQLLKRYGKPLKADHDGHGPEIIAQIVEPDTEFFIIGPPTSVGRFMMDNSDKKFTRATMQGGFVSYEDYRPKVTLDKFEGQDWMPTFNLNGDRKGTTRFLEAKIEERFMVGKNVCHTVIFDNEKFAQFKKPNSRAAEIFLEAGELYFEKHDQKKFHDPTAAVAHLHPEVGEWLFGKTVKKKNGWVCYVDVFDLDKNEDLHLVEIDREALWSHLWNWT